MKHSGCLINIAEITYLYSYTRQYLYGVKLSKYDQEVGVNMFYRSESSHPRVTGVKCQTIDQDKDLSLSRIQRDHQDAQKMFEFLAERNSFDIHTVLINLNSREVTDDSVNIFQAQAI